MSEKMVMPKAGLTNTEGTIGKWLFKTGDRVEAGQIIAEIENEKITMDFEAPISGYLVIVAENGETVDVGKLIGYIAEDEKEIKTLSEASSHDKEAEAKEIKVQEKTIEIPKTSETTDRKRIKISHFAKKKAEKAGFDYSKVKGTGPGGRIVAKDIENALKEIATVPMGSEIPTEQMPPYTEEKMTTRRKAIANNLLESLQSTAQCFASTEVDATEFKAYRQKLVGMEDLIGTKITINDLLTKVVSKVAFTYNFANATISGENIRYYNNVNVAVAVANDQGLVSPVVKNVDKLSLGALSKKLHDLVERARENKLTPDDFEGGTITISNLGSYPVDVFQPIANRGQSVIVGFGRMIEKPVVLNGKIEVRTMMTTSVTFDHRVLDGSDVGEILKLIKKLIENPELIVL